MVKAQQKRNTIITCTLATILVLLVAITLGNMVRGEARSLEKVTYPTSFKLSQSDTSYSFSELTYIMRDKDKAHYYVMEPEYYYYHWAEIIMKIQYPEREDPLVYWDEKSWWDYENADFHIYEDSGLTKALDISGNEFVDFSYSFDENCSRISFKLGEILDLLDKNGDSQNYYIVIEPHMTATTTHEGSPIVIEFKFKDTEYTTTRKSHSTTTDKDSSGLTWIDSDERDPVSQGIHVYQPSKYRPEPTTRTTTRTTRISTIRTISTSTETVTTLSTTKSTTTEKVEPTGTNKQESEQDQAYRIEEENNRLYLYEINREGRKEKSAKTGIFGYNGKQVYVENGVVNKDFSGKVVYQGDTYTVERGFVIDGPSIEPTSKKQDEPSTKKDELTTKKDEPTTKKNDNPAVLNGIVQGPDGKWAMYKDGVVNSNYTGIAKNSYGWWRVEKGYVNFNAQGIYKNDYGWWKTTNGKVTFDETGVFKNEYGWWRVEKSKVNFKANGIYKNQYGWWKTTKGKVTFKETGVFKNDYGWWRVEKSKVNFKANGLYKNEYGTWYVKNGKVDFNYNGTYQGKTIKGGKVQ